MLQIITYKSWEEPLEVIPLLYRKETKVKVYMLAKDAVLREN